MSSDSYDDDGLDSLDGERGITSVGEDGNSAANRGLIFIGLIGFLIVVAAMLFFALKGSADSDSSKQAKETVLRSSIPQRTFRAPEPLPLPEVKPIKVATPTPSPTPPPQTRQIYAPPPKAVEPAKIIPTMDQSSSSLMAVNGVRQKNTAPSEAGSPATTLQKTRAKKDSGGLSKLLSPTVTVKQNANTLGDRNFLLAKGSFIDCALQTRLDSTIPGMTACVVTRNIYSDNGKVLLIERGSTVSGEYSGKIKQGSARIFVLWSRIKTPSGVAINIGSPGTDSLGGAGVGGYIDNHFWDRFGSALLLSLVGDFAQGLANSYSDANKSDFDFSNSGDSVEDMSTVALKNSIGIPPTLYKNQGEKVGIYIARDLDFSSVYDVR